MYSTTGVRDQYNVTIYTTGFCLPVRTSCMTVGLFESWTTQLPVFIKHMLLKCEYIFRQWKYRYK